MIVFKKIPEELDQFDGDLVIAVVGADERPLQASNSWLDWRLYGALNDLLVRGLFRGELGEKCLLPTYGKFKFDRLILLGGGNLSDQDALPTFEHGQIRWNQISDHIEKTIRSLKVRKIGLSLPRFDLQDDERAVLQQLQASSLPHETSLFMARALTFSYSPLAC